MRQGYLLIASCVLHPFCLVRSPRSPRTSTRILKYLIWDIPRSRIFDSYDSRDSRLAWFSATHVQPATANSNLSFQRTVAFNPSGASLTMRHVVAKTNKSLVCFHASSEGCTLQVFRPVLHDQIFVFSWDERTDGPIAFLGFSLLVLLIAICQLLIAGYYPFVSIRGREGGAPAYFTKVV